MQLSKGSEATEPNGDQDEGVEEVVPDAGHEVIDGIQVQLPTEEAEVKPVKRRKRQLCYWMKQEGDHSGRTSERCCFYTCVQCDEKGYDKDCGCAAKEARDYDAKHKAEEDRAEGVRSGTASGTRAAARLGNVGVELVPCICCRTVPGHPGATEFKCFARRCRSRVCSARMAVCMTIDPSLVKMVNRQPEFRSCKRCTLEGLEETQEAPAPPARGHAAAAQARMEPLTQDSPGDAVVDLTTASGARSQERDDRGGQSTADRDEEVTILRAIAGRNPVALGQIEEVLTERLRVSREAGQDGDVTKASDRLLRLVEYGLRQEKGAPVEQRVSDRLDELDPGRHAATAPAGPSQLGVKRPKHRQRPELGTDEGKPKKGRGPPKD